MKRKKPSERINTDPSLSVTLPVACPSCESLERQYDDAIRHIREVLANRLKTLGEKVRDLHRWQEKRDEAIEAFYSHKRRHRAQGRNGQRTNAA